jgi:hypothetical protein
MDDFNQLVQFYKTQNTWIRADVRFYLQEENVEFDEEGVIPTEEMWEIELGGGFHKYFAAPSWPQALNKLRIHAVQRGYKVPQG